MKFRATILEMAASEIMQYIPANVYEEIKAKDPHPVFRAYVIGHEGESEGRVVGAGNIIKKWWTSAINKIADRLQYGIKVFHRHSDDNKHEGRTVIGHVVGKTKRIINDVLSAIAIIHIKPDYVDLPLNVASMEADVILNGDRDSGVYDADVEDITAVALGDRAVDRPGFPGATLLTQIQAFAKSQSQFNTGGGDMGNTVNDIRKVIKAEGYMPSDIYGMGELTKDPMIEEYIEKLEDKFEQSLMQRKKRINVGFDETKEKLIKEHEEKIKEKDEVITKLQGENIQSKTGDWLEKQKEKRELDDKQMKFINLNLDDFKPTEPDKAEDDFNKFLDDQIDKLSGISKDVFGEEPENKKKTPGGDPKDKKNDDSLVEDMSLED